MESENEIRLRASLRKAVGDQEADTLMEKLTSIEEVRAEMHMESARFTDMDSRFNEVDARFNEVDARFNEVDARFNQVDARFNQVDARFNQVDAHFNQVDAHFNKVDEHFVTLESQLLAMQKTFVKWGATMSISLFVTAVGVIVAAFLTR
jgi:archaellum component FlaC